MNSKLIYLDTNLWNRLKDQKVEPQILLAALAAKNANLALSGQTIYELSRTYLSSAPNASVRAEELFRYLKHYIDAEIPCAHDNMQQLHGEVNAIRTGASGVVAFYGPDEYRALRDEVDKLSQGIFDERAEQFIAGRKQFYESTRSDLKDHLEAKQHVVDRLKAVSEEQLQAWLDAEVLSDAGAAILTGHLLSIYSDIPEDTAIIIALALVHSPASRIAKGIVRADLYISWRGATRGSTPKDLVDDLYHVLNSSYCAVYATAEPAQANYASLILTKWTSVAIYDDRTPVDQWLLGLV